MKGWRFSCIAEKEDKQDVYDGAESQRCFSLDECSFFSVSQCALHVTAVFPSTNAQHLVSLGQEAELNLRCHDDAIGFFSNTCVHHL